MVTLLKTSRNAPWHPWETYRDAVLSLWPGARVVEAADWDGLFEGTVISLADEWDKPLSDQAARRLIDGVEAGGQLLVLHHGISLQARPDLAQLMGGRFLNHPDAGPLTFVPQGLDAPTWSFLDEPYRYDLLADVEPLLHYQDDEGLHLGGWTRRAGQGRVVCLMPGHTVAHWKFPGYRDFIKACWEKYF